MRRIGAAVAALTLAGGLLAAGAVTAGAAPSATASASACPTGWGSGAKGGFTAGAVPLKNIRTGQHDCYDRIVFDVPGGGTVGYSVHYVDKLYQDPSGAYIPVSGGAIIEIRVAAPSYDPESGQPTYPGRVAKPLPGVNISGYRTFRDTRFAGSFEGDTQIGLGVRARLPFRVIQLPDRLVVDVAHRWTA
ncbi:hypothetical protein ABZ027_30520 [Streptomyces sp. NPDC006332]|uniref:AMIN-like domain-containing (lipo)protein n=1 Tax=Streptomyces sp. NPDC006332 TaxID=3155456 RepID=UPI0033BF6299